MAYKAGDRLKLSKKQIAEIKDSLEKFKSYENTIADLSQRIGEAKNRMWGTIKIWFPDTDGYDMNAGINQGEVFLRILRETPTQSKEAT